MGGLGVTNYIVYIFYHSSFEFLMCFSFDAKKYGSYVIFCICFIICIYLIVVCSDPSFHQVII